MSGLATREWQISLLFPSDLPQDVDWNIPSGFASPFSFVSFFTIFQYSGPSSEWENPSGHLNPGACRPVKLSLL
jgi:hypothetical protein